jgi:hypothetical protein
MPAGAYRIFGDFTLELNPITPTSIEYEAMAIESLPITPTYLESALSTNMNRGTHGALMHTAAVYSFQTFLRVRLSLRARQRSGLCLVF